MPVSVAAKVRPIMEGMSFALFWLGSLATALTAWVAAGTINRPLWRRAAMTAVAAVATALSACLLNVGIFLFKTHQAPVWLIPTSALWAGHGFRGA